VKHDIAIRLAGIAMITLGGGMLAASIFFLSYNTWFLLTAETAEGEVVGWEYMENRDPLGTSWGNDMQMRAIRMHNVQSKSSLVRFRDWSGKEVFFAADVGSESGLHDKGERVTVLYRADDPGNAKIREFKALYLGPLLLIPFGVVFGFLGMLAKAFGEGPVSAKE
jgi:hypothetical protein